MNVFFTTVEFAANFAEAFIGYVFIGFVLNKKCKAQYPYIMALVQSLLLIFLQNHKLYSNYMVFVATVFVAVAVYIIYKVKFRIALTVSATYFINIVAFIELSGLVVWSIFLGQESIGRIIVTEQSVIRAAFALFVKAVQAASYFFARKYIVNVKKLEEIIYEHWKLIILADIVSYVSLLFLMNYIIIEITSDVVVDWLSYIVFFLLCFIIFAFYLRIRDDSEKSKLFETRNMMLEQNYLNIKRVSDQQAKAYHDFNNHLNMLYKYIKSKDVNSAVEYIEGIRQPFVMQEMMCRTGNEMVDFIINTKIMEAKRKKITVNLEANLYKISIPDRDLNCLLSNILDNAIEASEKGNENERVIDIWMKTVNATFMIKIKNNYVGTISKKGKIFLTSKKDDKIHGIGLEIVNDIVQKHDGDMRIDYDDKMFQMLIEIPMD